MYYGVAMMIVGDGVPLLVEADGAVSWHLANDTLKEAIKVALRLQDIGANEVSQVVMTIRYVG